jgi:hypothetical protein
VKAGGKKAGELVLDKTLEKAKGVWDKLKGWYKED